MIVGSRRDRINSVTRYLRAATGITSFAPKAPYGIECEYPYSVVTYTGRNLSDLSQVMNSLSGKGVPMLVWYRGEHDSPADAFVVFRANVAAELLSAHYRSEVLPRKKGGE